MTSRLARTDFGLAVAAEFDADRALAVEQNFAGRRPGDDLQIGPRQIRLDIGARRAPAFAVLLGDLIDAEPHLMRAVEVGVHRKLQLPAGFQEIFLERIGGPDVGDVERTAGAMKGVMDDLVVFGLS